MYKKSCGGVGRDFLKYQAELTKISVSSKVCVYTRPNMHVILKYIYKSWRGVTEKSARVSFETIFPKKIRSLNIAGAFLSNTKNVRFVKLKKNSV